VPLQIETIENYYKKIPNYTITKINRNITLNNIENHFELKVNKGVYIVLHHTDYLRVKTIHKDKVSKTSLMEKLYKPYQFNNDHTNKEYNLNNKHLFIWLRQCGYGDWLFHEPVIRFLKKKYPNIQITLAAANNRVEFIKSGFKHILSLNNNRDKVITTPFKAEELVGSDFHLVFDFHLTVEESRWKNVYRQFRKHVGLEEFDPNDECLTPRLSLPKATPKELLKSLPDKFILLQLRTSSNLRNPSYSFKLKILNKILNMTEGSDFKIVFIDTVDYKRDIDNLVSDSVDESRCINLCGETKSINDAVSVVGSASLVVSVDTGILHIAEGLSKKSVGIYGPFSAEARVTTYKSCAWVEPDAAAIASKIASGQLSSPCAPCAKQTFDLCDNLNEEDKPICYDHISMKDFKLRVLEQLK
jgi:ADP-heptose:LPS heptosyltransferase